jgi:glycosyltransferase involved in cell wall biosynthesis
LAVEHSDQLEELLAAEKVRGAVPIDSPIQRIAILTEAFLPKVDGVSRSALLTLRYLKATGREVVIFAPQPTLAEIDNIPVIGIPALPVPGYPESRVAPIWPPIYARLRAFKPDLIHLFSPFGLGAMGMLAGAWLKVPVIANYQTDLPAYARSYGYSFLSERLKGALRFLHNGCTLTLAPSVATLDELRGWGFKRLRLWERGIDLERFSPMQRDPAWRAKLLNGRKPTRLLALYVGRMAKDKHIETLHALAKEPGIALTLVGSGSHQPELQQLFSDTDAYFAGALLGDKLARAYASADIFVFPGPEETFGQVVLEAMASALPVIVTSRGGPQTMVTDGKNGYIVPVDDGAAFVEKARMLRDAPLLRAEMRQAARSYADTRPWLQIMQELEGYYTEAVHLNRRFRR